MDLTKEQLEEQNSKLISALREITKRMGRFNHDPMIHCNNTVEDMATIAEDVLKEIGAL